MLSLRIWSSDGRCTVATARREDSSSGDDSYLLSLDLDGT